MPHAESSADIQTKSGSTTAPSAALIVPPRVRLEQFVASLSPEDARSRLGKSIEAGRKQLKALGASIPSATNPLIVSLMESLKSLPSSESGARIAIVTALGRTGDAAILPPLLLVSGAGAKDVRRAVAIALGGLRHPLAAYILLPMLLDGSSRVKQSAFQALVQLNQPHTIEAILSACLCSKTTRNIIVDTLRQIPEGKRSRFFLLLNDSTADRDAGLKLVADSLRFDFRNEIPKYGQTQNKTETGVAMAGPNKSVSDDSRLNDDSQSDVRFAEDTGMQNGQSRQVPKAKIPAGDSRYPVAARSSREDLLKSAADSKISLDLNALNAPDDDAANDDEQLLAEQFHVAFTSTTDDRPNDSDDSGLSNDSLADLSFFNSIVEKIEDLSPSNDSVHLLNASSGSHPTTSLSGLLAGPEFPQHQGALPQGSAEFRPHNTSTPATSNPFIDAASSPLIDAFTPAFSDARSQSSTYVLTTTIGASQPSFDSNSASHPNAVLTSRATLDSPDESVEAEAAADNAARIAREKSLARLAAARDVALRKLVESADEIPNTLPRLLGRRVAKLLATPSTNIESVVEQIRYLGVSGFPAVLSTLSSFGQKPSKVIREASATAMGDIIHLGSAVLLLKLLADKSGTVAEAAIKSLTKLDFALTRPVLLAAGLCNNSLRTIVTAGAESATDEKKSEWEKFLLGVLQSRDTEANAFAVSLLVRITGDTHLDIYAALAADTSPAIRAAAIEALARTESKRSISKINDALLDADPSVRAQASAALATMYSPRSIELLQKLVFDSDLLVRRNVAQTMSRIDEADLAEIIEKALDQETDGTTVEYLLAALQRNGGADSLTVLRRYIEGEAGQFREQAVKALRKLKIPASIPIFSRLLDDRTAAMRRQSVEQLAALRSEEALPRLREMLKQDPDETVRSACARALGDFADIKSLHLLEEALEDHPLVRLQAVIAMGRLSAANGGLSLLSLLKDPQAEIRYQAVRALAQLNLEGSENSIFPLLEDPDEMVRRGAEQSLQDLGQSVRTIRARQWRKRIVSLTSKLMPSSMAGAVPGSSRTLLAVIAVLLLVGVWLGFSKMGFVMAGGEQLPVGRVLNVGISASKGTACVLRTRAVLDVWSVIDGSLSARVKVPVSAYGIMSEAQGGVVLLMQNQLGRLDPESGFSAEKMSSFDLSAVPSAIYFHQKSNSVCIFENSGPSTLLRVVDAATLKETKTHTLGAVFKGACVVSPDFSLALTLDSAGILTLCDVKSGEIVTASVAQMTGQDQLGSIFSVTFTDDMKYVCFCTSKSFLALTVNGMQLVKQLPSPDAYGFASAQPVAGGSNLVVMSASGHVFAFSDDFKKTQESRIERSSRFDLSAIGAGAELVVLANSEEKEFDVYSIKEQKMVLTVPGEE